MVSVPQVSFIYKNKGIDLLELFFEFLNRIAWDFLSIEDPFNFIIGDLKPLRFF